MSFKPLVFTQNLKFFYSKNQSEITFEQISLFQSVNYLPSNLTSYISKFGHRFKVGDILVVGNKNNDKKFDFILSSTISELNAGHIEKLINESYSNEEISIQKITICGNEKNGYGLVISCLGKNRINLVCCVMLEEALAANEILFM